MKGGHLVDLDWLWDITIKEIRLDLERIVSTKKQYFVGVTEVQTGKAVYLKPDKNNLEEILKASSSIPVLYRNSIKINDIDFVDGGLADPIPVIEAYKQNAKNIMVIRSRPYDYMMKSSSNNLFNKFYFRKYPQLLNAIENRSKTYQETIEFMRNPPKGVKILEVNPPDGFQTNRLTKDTSILKQDYHLGYEVGIDMIQQWNKEIK
jgi:predicted patatin/cPLA2 family phospholipase